MRHLYRFARLILSWAWLHWTMRYHLAAAFVSYAWHKSGDGAGMKSDGTLGLD